VHEREAVAEAAEGEDAEQRPQPEPGRAEHELGRHAGEAELIGAPPAPAALLAASSDPTIRPAPLAAISAASPGAADVEDRAREDDGTPARLLAPGGW
jgi:hypothetical protein